MDGARLRGHVDEAPVALVALLEVAVGAPHAGPDHVKQHRGEHDEERADASAVEHRTRVVGSHVEERKWPALGGDVQQHAEHLHCEGDGHHPPRRAVRQQERCRRHYVEEHEGGARLGTVQPPQRHRRAGIGREGHLEASGSGDAQEGRSRRHHCYHAERSRRRAAGDEGGGGGGERQQQVGDGAHGEHLLLEVGKGDLVSHRGAHRGRHLSPIAIGPQGPLLRFPTRWRQTGTTRTGTGSQELSADHHVHVGGRP